MLNIFRYLLKPLKTEYLMIFYAMKSLVMIFSICWLIVVANAVAISAATLQQQPQILNYKQQLQYQMQQHDKFEYQQHIKQQQQYYQQQYHQQNTPTAMALLQEQQQQQQHQQRLQHQQQQKQFLAVKPTQILQTAASLVVDDGTHPEALALGQSEFSNGNAQRRRPGTRKRKRRPQASNADEINTPTASNSPTYWRGQVEDDREALTIAIKSTTTKPLDIAATIRTSSQASFKRRKQPAIREPLAALEKEQKLYEMRNKPETPTESNVNRNSINLKNILKNSGGLSLSEILQQKNLSLDDLLKGKENALQALQTTATAPFEKSNQAKYPSFKPSFKSNNSSIKLTEGNGDEIYNSKERSKLTALHRLKLFGSSSRPSGIQVGLADHLTTRKREGNLYSITTTTTTTTTRPKPSTTKIPLYKKILHQRPTLKPTFLLKNTAVMAKTETERMVTSWDSKEQQDVDYFKPEEEEMKPKEEKEEDEVELMEDDEDLPQNMLELSTTIPELSEATIWKIETTIAPTTASSTTSTSTPRSVTKPTSEKSTTRDIATSTRRMYTSTRGSGRTTYRYSTSATTPATTTSTTTTTTTTTPLPETTTTTTSTTTASSSTMNLTPKAHLNLNTEDLRERIQETLLKNLIEKEDSFKKSPIAEENDNDEEDDLENFFEETIKPKTNKYFETSTITTRMKQYNPSFLYTTSTTSTTPSSSTHTNPTTTENLNSIPDFDNVDDRTDLLELIEDRRSGNRLFKVLEQRNMTLEELIEHRKRGSSQLHLATIVETPSLFYPEKKVVLQDNMDIVTAFENFPHFNLLNLKSVKPDDIKTDSQGSSYFTSIIDIEPTDEVYKNRKGGQALTAELDKASLLPDRSEKSLGFFPSWKTLALASLGPTNSKKETVTKLNTNNSPFFLQQPKMLLENNSNNNNENDDDDEDVYDIKENELTIIGQDEEDDYQQQNPIQAAVRLPDHTAEAIENEVARAHDLVDLELSGHGFKRSPQAAGALAHSHRHGSFYNNMPPGIKSAIVASATIVLTALVTFMVIFAVCKWKQRRHRMSNIMKSYNAMKSKLPTIATTTLGAASTANTTNSNSRRSSLREMQNLLGGSGLSVAATITTTASTGVPNTPIHTVVTPSSPPLTASQTTTMLAGNCSSKNINNIYNHNTNNSNNTTNSNSSNYICGLRPLQRQSSLLFQRSFNQNNSHSAAHSNNDKPTNLSILSGCNLLDLKRNNKMSGSTTSLSFSLTSGHNISNTHINTMDANSPEVQEYLFDTLRNSF